MSNLGKNIEFLEDHPDGMILSIFVQPRSSKTMIAGIHGSALKIKLTAPPVDNAANKMCIAFLAKQLKMPKSALTIISGDTSRNKRMRIICADNPTRIKIRQYFQSYS
jgi:uncharacterized protein